MNIVTSINKNFVQHFCSMCASLILNNSNQNINVFILHSDLDGEQQQKITNALLNLLSDKINLFYVEVKEDQFSSIPIIESHLSIQTLFRILLSELLPLDVEKLIYLDSDLVVEGSLDPLYSIDISNDYLAAVSDFNDELAMNQGINSGVDYFNSGVMLVNLKRWRQSNFLNECLNYAIENKEKLRFPDQDILNGVLKGKWTKLDISWNVTRMFFDRNTDDWTKEIQPLIKNAKSNPKIIHYTTWQKPWFYLDTHPLKERYFFYLDQTKATYVKYFEKNILEHSNIVIFGASLGGQRMKSFLEKEGLEVTYFTDNSEAKWGTYINNIKIISPSELASVPNFCVIIASAYAKEISTQLENMSLSKVVPLIYQ